MKNDLHLRETANHGTFSFPFQFYQCTIPETYTSLTMHWHEEMEITLIQDGVCNYLIDLNTYQVKKGDIIILSPHMLHGARQSGNNTMVSDSIVFNLNMLGYSYPDSCTTKYLLPLANKKWQFPIIVRSSAQNVTELKGTFIKIKTCYLEQHHGFELELKSALFHFLGLMFQCAPYCTDNDKGNSDAAEKIKLVLQYIQEHYQKSISILS
ncbi:MAG: AraC family ligand binding domain-containing protein [Lachnospiraceae bacterium]